MTEREVMMNGGEPHTDPLLPTEVSDIVKANGVARNNVWNKPQISIEEADDVISFSPPTTISTALRDTTEGVGSSGKVSSSLSIDRGTRVYPRTPPANYKFYSPTKKEESSLDSSQEGSCGDSEMRESGEWNGRSASSTTEDNYLHVMWANTSRSHSLPTGIKFETHHASNTSDEMEGGTRRGKHKRGKRLDYLKYQERLGSAGSDISPPETTDDSSSDGIADEDNMDEDIPAPEIDPEDEIFIDSELSGRQEQADTKLLSWACNDFVSACHQVLSRCCENAKLPQDKSVSIQYDLRSLFNTITFFCSEQQQRLSQVFQVRPILPSRGGSQSSVAQTIPRPLRAPAESSPEEAGEGRGYAVKVLSTASQSLIAPLIEASRQEGFTSSLHQSVIKALQKLAWKVEACLSLSNPSNSVAIHAKIFDAQHVENVRDLMIQALPPAEPNLRVVHHPLRMRKSSEPAISVEAPPIVPMRRGQSVKEKLGSELVMERECVSHELENIGELEGDNDDDEVWKETGEDKEAEDSGPATLKFDNANCNELTVKQVPLKEEADSRETTPTLPRRERFATEGEVDLLNKVQLSRKANFGSIPNLDREGGSSEGLNDSGASCRSEMYFRPRAFRRTTVSLSRKEVQTLGLTVAKRVDESILDDIREQREQEAAQRRTCKRDHQGSKSEEKAPRGSNEDSAPGQRLELQVRSPQAYGIDTPEDMEEVGNRLHNTLTKRFDRIRSVSMSNILDCDEESLADADPSNSDRESDAFSPQPNQRLELVPLDKPQPFSDPHSVVTSLPSQPLAAQNYRKSYTPLRRGTLIPASSSSDSVSVEGEKRKKSMRGRAKQRVKKSLSTSGRLAHSLLKTARSLRQSSSLKLQETALSKSHSAADLLNDSTAVHPAKHQHEGSSGSSRLSASITSTVSYDTATLPSRGKRMNTIARIMRRGRDLRSRSFGKSDKYASIAFSSCPEDYGCGDRAFADSIETVSRNAIHSMAIESEEQLLISVDMATKLQKKQAMRGRSSIGRESSSNPWFQITVNTNITRFGRQDYIILRPFKEIQKLIDTLSSSHGAIDLHVPRPDKKSGAKKQMKGMDDLLRSIAGNAQLRSNPAFITFLTPDDQFGSFTENDRSEVSFERLMTFYTPDLSSGPPGSFPSVQVVPADHVPATPSADASHKSSLKAGHKKGSMHYMKKDGKDDTSTYVIQEEGEDALIVACEDDHYVVVAGTFEKLVEQLACEEKPDARFVTTFLLGYRHFATTMEFLTKLLERFHMTLPPNPTDEEMAYAEKWSYVIQLRVLDILTYWIKKCWPDIYRHPPVLEKLREFATSLKSTDDHNFQYAGTNIEKIIKEKIASSAQYCLPPDTNSLHSHSPLSSSHSPTSSLRQHHRPLTPHRASENSRTGHHYHEKVKRAVMSVPHSVPSSPLHHVERISSSGSYGAVDICSLPAIQLARQLTLIELEFLRAIDVHELVVFTWDPNTPENKPYRRNLDAFIDRFNKVSYWVASEICCVEDSRLRGILIEKFIEVAKHCQEFKNYNTTISVLSGLSLAAVRRLKRAWELVNEKTKKWFTKLQPLTSPTTNHSNYRRALATVPRREPCIPYLGVFMRDLTFFNDGNTKRLKNGLYNFSKLRTMVYKFEELKRYQRSKYFFPPEDKIREFCRNLWCLSESELYEMSLRTEPRVETDI